MDSGLPWAMGSPSGWGGGQEAHSREVGHRAWRPAKPSWHRGQPTSYSWAQGQMEGHCFPRSAENLGSRWGWQAGPDSP